MRTARRWLVGICLALPAAVLGGATRSVPRDYATIKSAVLAATPGDTVEVDDGYYYEDTIILDKPLILRARNPFRTVICGTGKGFRAEAILMIRSSVVIEGLVLRNGASGILQRNSPDVDWKARNLGIFNMERAAISINDPVNNIGRGRVENLIVDGCGLGIETNDAYGFEVVNGFIASCRTAFRAYDHVYFRLNNIVVWNCPIVFSESTVPVRPPRTNTIRRGPQITVLDDLPADADRILEGLRAAPRFFAAPQFSGRDVPSETISRGIFLLIAGGILFERGECRRAESFFDTVLRLSRESGSEELSWRAQLGLAACLERQGRLLAALGRFQESLDIFEALRARVVLQHSSPGFFEDKRAVYLSLIHLLQELNQQNPSGGYLARIFSAMERSKARGFIDSLEEAELGLSAMATPDLQEEEARLSGGIAQLQTKLHYPYLSDSKRLQLEVRLNEMENAYTDMLIRIRRRVYGAVPPPLLQPLDYPEVRKRLLDAETALVEYMIGPDYSVAILVTAATLSVNLLPGEQELRRLTENYLRYLMVPTAGDFRALKGGQRLRDLFLGPFGSELQKGIRRIIIVPDGELIDLPFEALVDTDGRYLVEKYEFSYVHSASTLVMLQERTRKRTGDDLLVVGVSQPPRSGSSVFQFSPQLSQLRYVSSEARAVARGYVGGRSAS